MKTEQQAVLGILGGMGPLATVDFLHKLTRLTVVTGDQNHVPWITFSQPGTPDRSSAIEAGNDGPSPFLTKGVAWLAAQGVQLIAVPCSTSHFWHEEMAAACSVPILHIADATIEVLQQVPIAKGYVAVLATRGTVQAGIYSRPLTKKGFVVLNITETHQRAVDRVIRDIKGGQIGPAREIMRHLVKDLVAQGVRIIVLGCTELPIACELPNEGAFPEAVVIDTTLVLATVSLRRLKYSVDMQILR